MTLDPRMEMDNQLLNTLITLKLVFFIKPLFFHQMIALLDLKEQMEVE